MYRCMYIWNHTSQLDIMDMQHIHAGCRIQKSKVVAPCEQCHSHPDNLLLAIKTQSHSQTSLHSSRMPTALALVDHISQHALCRGGAYSWGGGLLLGGFLLLGGLLLGGLLRGSATGGVPAHGWSAWGGGIPACTEADNPPVDRITDACKNITFSQLRCGR